MVLLRGRLIDRRNIIPHTAQHLDSEAKTIEGLASGTDNEGQQAYSDITLLFSTDPRTSILKRTTDQQKFLHRTLTPSGLGMALRRPTALAVRSHLSIGLGDMSIRTRMAYN